MSSPRPGGRGELGKIERVYFKPPANPHHRVDRTAFQNPTSSPPGARRSPAADSPVVQNSCHAVGQTFLSASAFHAALHDRSRKVRLLVPPTALRLRAFPPRNY